MNYKYEIIFRLKKIIWFITRPKRQGVKCVLENDGKIMMLRRSFGTDKFVFPGGAIRNDESPEAAARREIKEDLGIDLGPVKSLGSFNQTVHHRQEVLHCFSSPIGATEINLDKQKIKEVKWFPSAKLPELTPVSRSVMNQYEMVRAQDQK